jgi:F0F1-type ATP synthase alpha subunit
MSEKAKLIVKKVEKVNDQILLYVDTISDGIVKLYGVYNLADKFNIRLNNFIPNSTETFIHPIENLCLHIQLIDNYKKIDVGDILIPIL